MNVINVGILTSPTPLRLPKPTTCAPSKIWNIPAMINSCDAITKT